MKMKKIISLVLAATMILSLTVFAGCGNDKQNGGSSSTDSDGNGEYTGKVVEITVCDLITTATGSNRFNALRQQQFEKDHPEIKVNHVSLPAGDTTNMVEYLTTLFMGDNSPVCYSVSSTYYMRDLYNSDLAADISPYISEESFDKMYDYVSESVKYGDAIIGYPTGLEVPLLGFLNESLEKAGYDPSAFTCETWDDYLEVAGKMTSDGISGSSLYVYEYYLWPANWFQSNSAEPAIQNEDGTITLDFTNSKVIETIEFFKKLYNSGYTNSNITYTQISEMQNLMLNKKLASFTFYPTWLSQFVAAGINAEDITVTPFPKGPSYEEGTPYSNVLVSGNVFNARKSEEELQAAVTYTEYMAGYESAKEYIEYATEKKIANFSLPPFKDIDWETPLKTNNIPENWINTTKTVLNEGYVSPLHSTAFTTYLTPQFGKLIRENLNITDVLKDAQKTAEREWLDDFNAYLK